MKLLLSIIAIGALGLSFESRAGDSQSTYEAKVVGKKRYHGTPQQRVFRGSSDRSLGEARSIAWQKCSYSEMTSCSLVSCVERGVPMDANSCRSTR